MQHYNEDSKPTFLSLFTFTIVFLVLGLLSLWFSISVTNNLFSAIQGNSDIVVFDKVGFYFYGIGLGLLIFPFSIIYSKLLKYQISKKGEHYLNWILVFSIILMFILPQVVHYYTSAFMKKNNYIVCKGKSKRALYITTIEYSKKGKCRFK